MPSRSLLSAPASAASASADVTITGAVSGSTSKAFYDPALGSGTQAFSSIAYKDLPAGAELVPASALTDSETKNNSVSTTGGSTTWSHLPTTYTDPGTGETYKYYYYVVETDATATADTMSVSYAYQYHEGDPANGIKKVTITNTTTGTPPTLGSLVINKEVLKNAAVDTTCNDTFYFAVYHASDNVTTATPVKTGSVQVTNGQGSTTINGLSNGNYVVYELNGNGGQPITDGTGTINGVEYTVTAEEVASASVPNVKFTNATVTSGSLSITKNVTVNGEPVSDHSKASLADGEYVFSVVGPTAAEQSEQVTKYVQITVTNGRQAVSYKVADANTTEAWSAAALKNSSPAIVDGLVEGNYVISELAPTNGTTLTEASGGISVDSTSKAVTVHVTAGQETRDAQASFTNNINTGSLTVSKTVNGASAEEVANDTFTFTVTLTPPTGVTLAESYPAIKTSGSTSTTETFTVSSGTFTLKAGETYTIQDLPAGTVYSVAENAYDKYTSSITGGTNNNGTGTIADTAGSNVTVTATNTRNTGSLTITKAVEPSTVDASDTIFTFEVTFKNEDDTAYVGDVKVVDRTRTSATSVTTNDSGKLTVTVTGTGTATISEIPAGTKYEVVETSIPDGWEQVGTVQITGENADKVIGLGETENATITNTKQVSIYAKKTWNGKESWPEGMSVTFQIKQYKGETEQTEFTTTADANGNDTSVTIAAQQTKTWTNLPKYYLDDNNAKEYVYRVVETAVLNNGVSLTEYRTIYTVTGEGSGENGSVTINNQSQTTERHAKKIWIDNNNASNLRPASITFTLKAKANNVELTNDEMTALGIITAVQTITPDASTGEWPNADWRNLPQYTNAGALITYDVEETAVDNYTQTGTEWEEETKTWTFANTLGEATAEITATKSMKGGEPPANYSFKLTAKDGAPMPEGAVTIESNLVKTVSNDTSGVVSFGKIKYKLSDMESATLVPGEGNESKKEKTFTYTVQEVIPEAATAENHYTANGIKYDSAVYTVSVKVTYNSSDGTLTAANPVYSKTEGETTTNAEQIAFVNEELVDIDATKTWRKAGDDTASINATLKNAQVTFELQQKIGEGDWTKVGVANNPQTLQVTDKANAEAWKASWTDLPKYQDGVQIKYKVVESDAQVTGATVVMADPAEAVAEDYSTEGHSNPTATVYLINTITELGSLNILKTGTVNNLPPTETNKDKIDGDYSFTIAGKADTPTAGNSVQVKITLTNGIATAAVKDGTSVPEDAAVSIGGGIVTVSGLPVGVYTVTETLTAEQTAAGISLVGENGLEITINADQSAGIPTAAFVNNNTETTELNVSKVWASTSPADHPTSVTFKVYRIGYYTDGGVDKKASEGFYPDNSTVYTITSGGATMVSGLPTSGVEKVEGKDRNVTYIYSVVEQPVGGSVAYWPSYAYGENGSVTITNTPVEDTEHKTNVSVEKNWKDSSGQDASGAHEDYAIQFTLKQTPHATGYVPVTLVYTDADGRQTKASQEVFVKRGSKLTFTLKKGETLFGHYVDITYGLTHETVGGYGDQFTYTTTPINDKTTIVLRQTFMWVNLLGRFYDRWGDSVEEINGRAYQWTSAVKASVGELYTDYNRFYDAMKGETGSAANTYVYTLNKTSINPETVPYSGTVEANENWKAAFANLPQFQKLGTDFVVYTYEIAELKIINAAGEEEEVNIVEGKTYNGESTNYQVAWTVGDNGMWTITNTQKSKVQLIIEKVKADEESVKLAGAEFALVQLNETTGAEINDTTKTGTTSSEEGKEGTLTFEDLYDGVYKITETKAPAGYTKPANNVFYVKIENGVATLVTKTVTGEGEGATVTWPEVTEGNTNGITINTSNTSNTVTVPNTPGVELPSTGGPGTILYTTAGLGLMALAILALLLKRRKEQMN